MTRADEALAYTTSYSFDIDVDYSNRHSPGLQWAGPIKSQYPALIPQEGEQWKSFLPRAAATFRNFLEELGLWAQTPEAQQQRLMLMFYKDENSDWPVAKVYILTGSYTV